MAKSKRKTSARKVKKKTVSPRSRRGARLRKPSSTLSAADWVSLALDLLAENNVNGLEISELCQRLGVTKGSFYWHFDSLGDLLTAIVDDWCKRTTLNVNTRLSRNGAPAPVTLHRLLTLIRQPRSGRKATIERSVRDWARLDPLARDGLVKVDQTRLAFIDALLRQSGFPEKEAHIRAYTAYAIMMGDSILKETIDFRYAPEDYVDSFVEILLGLKGRSHESPAVAERRPHLHALPD